MIAHTICILLLLFPFFAKCLFTKEAFFPLTYTRESVLHFPSPRSQTKIYNEDPDNIDCHLQVFCPFSTCLQSKISRDGKHFRDFYVESGNSDTFTARNINAIYFESPSSRCALHYNCHKKNYDLQGDLNNSSRNPYWKENLLRFQRLTQVPQRRLSCQTTGGRNCVSGVYKVETNSMVYFHTANCFPGLSAKGRNLNPYQAQKEYYCPTELHGDTLYRSMPKFWLSLEKCSDPDPSCYSDFPLEVTEGLTLGQPCLTVKGGECFDRPWMDQNGFWRLGCTFMLQYSKWMCAGVVGNTGIALELEECRSDQEFCLNGNHQLIPKGFMDHAWMDKPWIRMFPKDFELENNSSAINP